MAKRTRTRKRGSRNSREQIAPVASTSGPSEEDYRNLHRSIYGTDAGYGAPPMPTATYDSTYNNDIALGQAEYGTTMAGIGLSRSRLGYDTGFGADGSPDISNPYNQAMMLQRHAEQAQRGITNSAASRGQLYSRARQRNSDEASFQYERSRSNLQTSAQRGYEDLTSAERAAGNALSGSQYGAAANQAGRWQDMERDWFERYS